MDNNYTLLNEIASGSQGKVYRAIDKTVGRFVAIKQFFATSFDEKKALYGNLELIKNCFHPALPMILNFYEENGKLNVVMEYIRGITLQEYIEIEGPMSYQEVIQIARKLTDVLSYLHNHGNGLIYSDLKPENIIIDSNKNIRLIDSGSIISLSKTLNLTKGCNATLGYASPEQQRGTKLTTRSDIYSLGAILHFLLSGEDPTKPPYIRRPLLACDRTIPSYIAGAIAKALSEDDESRYPTVEAFMNDLLNPKRNIFHISKPIKQNYKQEKLIFLSQGKKVGILIAVTIALVSGIVLTSGNISTKAQESKETNDYTLRSNTDTIVYDQAGSHIVIGRLKR